jgi:hypothetical protein
MKAELSALSTESKDFSLAYENIHSTTPGKSTLARLLSPVALSESASIAAMEPELLSVKDKRALFEQQSTGAIAAGNNKPPREPRISNEPIYKQAFKNQVGEGNKGHLDKPLKSYSLHSEFNSSNTLSIEKPKILGESANVARHEIYKTELRKIMEKPSVSDPRLNYLMDKLYRENAQIGSGSTAAAIRHEIATGSKVGNKLHTQKGKDFASALERWLDQNPTAELKDRDSS